MERGRFIWCSIAPAVIHTAAVGWTGHRKAPYSFCEPLLVVFGALLIGLVCSEFFLGIYIHITWRFGEDGISTLTLILNEFVLLALYLTWDGWIWFVCIDFQCSNMVDNYSFCVFDGIRLSIIL